HLHDILGNRLSLSSLLCSKSTESAGCIDKADNRTSELFSLFHESESLSVSLRMSGTEISLDFFLCVGTFFKRNYSHRYTVDTSYSSDDGIVVTKSSITVKFYKITENIFYIIYSSWPAFGSCQ